MPEFENLEPFLDRKRDCMLTVAPHTTAAHDFVVRRRDQQARSARKQVDAAPEPAQVDDANRLTTREMEKAYREAMKASRARKKAQDRRQGNTLFKRLWRTVSGLFTKTGEAPKKGRRPRRKPASRASSSSGQRSRSQDRGAKSKGQQRSPAGGEKRHDGGKGPSDAPRKRSRNRRRGGKSSGRGGAAAQAGTDKNQAPEKRPQKGGGPRPDAGKEAGNRSRRRRPRRNRNTSPSQPNTPKSSE